MLKAFGSHRSIGKSPRFQLDAKSIRSNVNNTVDQQNILTIKLGFGHKIEKNCPAK